MAYNFLWKWRFFCEHTVFVIRQRLDNNGGEKEWEYNREDWKMYVTAMQKVGHMWYNDANPGLESVFGRICWGQWAFTYCVCVRKCVYISHSGAGGGGEKTLMTYLLSSHSAYLTFLVPKKSNESLYFNILMLHFTLNGIRLWKGILLCALSMFSVTVISNYFSWGMTSDNNFF